MLFRRIVLSALVIGALSGLLLSGVQRWQVIPIIGAAEGYEEKRTAPTVEPVGAAAHMHEHPAGQPADHARAIAGPDSASDHHHEAGAWEPADGAERIAFTVLSNVLSAAGFALVMLAAMTAALRYGAGTKRTAATRLDWRSGLLWGLAGYVVFFVAPTLGLPPEIPGAEAAAFESRQLWWMVTVASTAAGLALLAFARSPWRWAGIALLVVPHVVGAPHLETSPFAGYPASVAGAMSALARDFVWATALANAVFWLVLGALSGWTAKRYVKQALA